MTVRLYVDEDAMDKGLVQALRARGIDVLTASEAGMIERQDEEHLKFAADQGRVLYTFMWGTFMGFIRSIWQTGNLTPESSLPANSAIL